MTSFRVLVAALVAASVSAFAPRYASPTVSYVPLLSNGFEHIISAQNRRYPSSPSGLCSMTTDVEESTRVDELIGDDSAYFSFEEQVCLTFGSYCCVLVGFVMQNSFLTTSTPTDNNPYIQYRIYKIGSSFPSLLEQSLLLLLICGSCQEDLIGVTLFLT